MTNAELIKALRETDFGYVCEHCEHEDMCRNNDCVIIQAADALEADEQRIAELEAQMPKEGEWIPINWTYDSILKCSNCGELACCCGDYCPNCGAK